MDETDLRHLRRCVELAEQALDEGDEPFGSVLVTEDGAVLASPGFRALLAPDVPAPPLVELG